MRIKKYYKLIRVDYEDTAYFRITNTSNTDGVFTITRNGSPTTANLKYSLDGVNWTTADLSADLSLDVDAGANVYMKGTNTSGFNRNGSNYYQMAMDVNHTIGGNIMSIVDETNYATVTSIPQYCFNQLFIDDIHLTDASGVNFGSVTSISNYGCSSMYRGCTSLTKGSDLSSVTSIGNYGCSGMYYNCTSLTTGIDLSSVTSIGYIGCEKMYRGCTSLTTASDLSNVESIGQTGLNEMYYYCTSLTTASDLSNVTSIAKEGCKNMYNGCTSLTTPSDLSSVTSIGDSGCYSMYENCTLLTTPSNLSNVESIEQTGLMFMYRQCTSLTTGSDLSSVTSVGSQACVNMYYSCRSLTKVTAPNISSWNTSNFSNWLDYANSTGVVRKPAGLTIPTGTSGVPSGWTTENY